MESSDSKSEVIRVKKRRNVNEWKRNKIKRLKAEGQENVNWKGNIVASRTGANCSCRKKCFNKFSNEAMLHILNRFNAVGKNGQKVAQDVYLQGIITPRAIARRRPRKEGGKQRIAAFIYKIKLVTGIEEHIVCLKAFCSLHGIKMDRARRLSKLANMELSPVENRGKHTNHLNAVPEGVLQLIDLHIRKFPYRVSHYSSTAKRRYLGSTLTVPTMYELFLKEE